MSARYALYFAPAVGSELERFGNRWLGRDAATGEALRQPAMGGLDNSRLRAVTEAPRHYGFHGTLKPPFRLAERYDEMALRRALAAFAARQQGFAIEALRLQEIGNFLAFAPLALTRALSALADACVRELDHFRAPPEPAELAKRRASGLNPRQDELLERWGYPYVLDEFRFHVSLTGPIDDGAERALFMKLLEPLVAPMLSEPVPVRELCLFQQPGHAAPFRLVDRFAFAS